MYTARGQGGNCFRFYSADMEAEALKRLSLEFDLRRALERGEIILHYQPQVEMAAGRIVGAEALVRRLESLMVEPTRVEPTSNSVNYS